MSIENWINLGNLFFSFVMLCATVYTLRLLIRQTKDVGQQTEQLNHSVRLETYQRVYDKMLEIDLFFVENPELKPYFYHGKPVDDKKQRQKLLCMAETMVDLFYGIYFQRVGMPDKTWEGWARYIQQIVCSSPIIDEYLEAAGGWYEAPFIEMLRNPAKAGKNEKPLRKKQG